EPAQSKTRLVVPPRPRQPEGQEHLASRSPPPKALGPRTCLEQADAAISAAAAVMGSRTPGEPPRSRFLRGGQSHRATQASQLRTVSPSRHVSNPSPPSRKSLSL